MTMSYCAKRSTQWCSLLTQSRICWSVALCSIIWTLGYKCATWRCKFGETDNLGVLTFRFCECNQHCLPMVESILPQLPKFWKCRAWFPQLIFWIIVAGPIQWLLRSDKTRKGFESTFSKSNLFTVNQTKKTLLFHAMNEGEDLYLDLLTGRSVTGVLS